MTTKSWHRVLLMLLLVVLVICGVVTAIFPPAKISDSRTWTLYTFGEALRENDKKAVHRLATSEHWEWLDDWMAQREPFRCPFTWDPDNVRVGISCQECENEGVGQECCSYWYRCISSGGPYSLGIDNVIVAEVEGGFRVVDWERVCEKAGTGEQRTCDTRR